MSHCREIFIFLLFLFVISFKGNQIIAHEHGYSTQEYNNTMKWGTYRPNLYFGMKTRDILPTQMGFLWYNTDNFLDKLRYTCEPHDGVTVKWKVHDGKTYGEEIITDPQNNLQLNIKFFKNPRNGNLGGDFSIRIEGKSLDKNTKAKISTFFVFEDSNNLKLSGMRRNGLTNPVVISGKNENIGKFNFYMRDQSEYKGESLTKLEQLLEKFHFIGLDEKFSKDKIFEYFSSKKIVNSKNSNEQIFTLSNRLKSSMKTMLVQKVITTPFTLEYALMSNEHHSTNSLMKRNVQKMLGKKLTNEFKKKEKEFNSKFKDIFQLNSHLDFGKSALSNLIGGIGYFSGSSIHQYEDNEPILTSSNNVLFCTTPSRSFFPRGFLWDEGFHQLLIQKWDKELYKDIFVHWMNLMDYNGWIAREQILGEEARSKVPPEFQKQISTNANPPTLFLSLSNILDNLKLKKVQVNPNSGDTVNLTNHTNFQKEMETNEDTKDVEFLKKIFPKLKLYYSWFFKTQSGSIKDSFRWRGRTKGHNFASGLDDYPRGSLTPVLSERHLDLYCWMYMISDLMNQICDILNIKDHIFLQNQNTLKINLDKLHLNTKLGIHSDYVGVNYDNKQQKKGKEKSEFSNHLGYINLFPLITDMISIESEKFDILLNLLNNPKHLYSSYGIRSLSLNDKLFGTKENYWRGPIWINMNYLILRSLHRIVNHSTKISQKHLKAKEIYSKLRNNLIMNVYNNWKKTGCFYEQYNPKNGHGQRLNDFHGWTTIILLILAEKY